MTDGRLCIFGEVLFDHFPDGKQVLGGAPFNVAWHLQAFGQAPHFISRVGSDPEGASIRTAMDDWGMDLNGLQTDPELATGRVDITFADGEPSYDIVRPCAYDAIAAPTAAPDCRLLYHGSLALRGAASRAALAQLKVHAPKTVFVDVNLRSPWWQVDQLIDLLRAAHWVKLNREELTLLGGTRETPPRAADFLAAHELDGLIVTHGAAGAELLTRTGEHYAVTPDSDIEVVDTVGAGDAFASVMILGLIQGWPLELTLQRAQRFASKLVGNRGATVRDAAFYQPLINAWQLDA